ncbi:hypothetical protein WUBG_11851, partial [Wuchereria bancrofti]
MVEQKGLREEEGNKIVFYLEIGVHRHKEGKIRRMLQYTTGGPDGPIELLGERKDDIMK